MKKFVIYSSICYYIALYSFITLLFKDKKTISSQQYICIQIIYIIKYLYLCLYLSIYLSIYISIYNTNVDTNNNVNDFLDHNKDKWHQGY